jgi:hypothetical protein
VRGDPVVVGPVALQLFLDRVRRQLPDLVEPVEEDVELGAPCGVAREEGRVRVESTTTSSPSTSTGTRP